MLQGTTINSALAIPKDVGLTKRKPNYVIWLQIQHYSTIIRDYKKPLSHQTPSFLLVLVSLPLAICINLPSIQKKPIFENFKNDGYNLCHPWHVFKMIGLIEIMRQKDDNKFTALLSRIRTQSHSQDGIKCHQMLIIQQCKCTTYMG